MSITKNIRAAREEAGLTQVEAARQLGVTNVYLNYCESLINDQSPSLPLLRRMAGVYETTVSHLTEGE
ncbi:MAG: helix-turn-helix transcriptional regulator [Acidiferrobacterales bacterium]